MRTLRLRGSGGVLVGVGSKQGFVVESLLTMVNQSAKMVAL
jgi:hypothetical protein